MTNKIHRLNRRAFLSRSLGGAAALTTLQLTASQTSGAGQGTLPAGPAKPITRVLGRTGIEVPVVSLGVMNADNPALVRRAIELGVRHLDTAAVYQRGRNEEMVGAVVKEMGARQQLTIATKIFLPPERRSLPDAEIKAYYLKTLEQSLTRLQTDHVDVLYSHNISDTAFLNHPGVLEALRQLKQEGKTRAIGFSTHLNMEAVIRDAARTNLYEVILTTYNYALAGDAGLAEALKQAAARGIGLVAMKTQCSQYWYKQEMPAEIREKYYDGRLLQPAMLKWALQNPAVATAIPGCTTFAQLEEDWPVAYNLAFSQAEKKFLGERGLARALGYCRQCRRCTAVCPRGVEVPTLMRVHMYAACYNNFELARQTIDELPPARSLTACRSCGACRAACPAAIDTGKRLDDLRAIFA